MIVGIANAKSFQMQIRWSMDRKQKEGLVIALAEKGKTYQRDHQRGRSVSKHDQSYLE